VVNELSFSPDPQAAYLVVEYVGVSIELRRTEDGAPVPLSGRVTGVGFSPDPQASYFVVSYASASVELRRTADGALLAKLPDRVIDVAFSPDPQSAYFLVGYNSAETELWQAGDNPSFLVGFGLGILIGPYEGVLGVRTFFNAQASRLVLHYTDGRAYLLDLDWLSAMGGDPAALAPEELERLACEGPFASGAFEEAALQPYLEGQPSQVCR
jgi:hypothetical protein